MSLLSPTISQSFGYYFQDFLQRVLDLSSDLSEDEFWSNPFPFGNSVGNLVLHITGNLHYYIGAQLAASGYIRTRAREFAVEEQPSKASALHELRQAIALVNATLAAQTEADWSAPYRATGVDDVHDRFSIFLRCAVHFHHHIGQMCYTHDELLRRRNR
jgi:uncharacterized damage-inducible protein DinB